MPDLQKATELANRYTLVRKLGGGGAAETWLATDRMTRAQVALKILADDRLTAENLRQEWQTSIRLMHAHIVRVFEFHDEGMRPFYSLQFVDGPDISVLSGAPLEHLLPPIALIVDALRYAHGKNVVHRDVKASNILLDHNGAPYLIDFGVAGERGNEPGGGSLIAASPQSLAGEPPSGADDIFALGGLIYELVSGRSPYSSASTAEDIKNVEPAPLHMADGAAAPEALRSLVAAMLNKDASRRPDAEAIVEALQEAGYAGGPAPATYVAGRQAATEFIEAAGEIRPRAKTATAPPSSDQSDRGGLSSRVVGIGLVVLLVLLIGVIFFLPDTVTDQRQEPVATEAVAEADDTANAAATEGDRGAVPQRDERVVARGETEAVLGELLSKMDTLDKRAVQRWGGLRYKQAQAVYAAGDEAYLARDYGEAMEKYREAIGIVDPLLDEVDRVFAKAMVDGQAALDAADSVEALRHFELAAAISPSYAPAQAGYTRARNLDTVIGLTDQGLAHEKDLELDAAKQSFSSAIELDPQWGPASEGLARVNETIRQRDFDQRMTEGLMALADGDYAGARAAFRVAQTLKPGSREPADGLLQVDQGIRLDRIATLEYKASGEEQNEQWAMALATYEDILEIDANLLFAQEGRQRAEEMTALHEQIDEYIKEPDRLSAPSTMRSATKLVVDITRMPDIGPRLSDQRDELSRLLKRAATPLTVQIVSDNITDVSIYKIGKLGSFATHELSLRPGNYVAVGSRPGYRDVRLEFRVGPEVESKPIVVRCEETI